MNPRLLRAWRQTDFEAGGAVARIGQRSAAVDTLLDRLGSREGAFITAWNPNGRKKPVGWNQRAMRRFQEATRRIACRAGQGCGTGPTPRWCEDHFLLAIAPGRAAVISRRFQQLGFVRVRRGQRAVAVIL